jgi:hypothetical protein
VISAVQKIFEWVKDDASLRSEIHAIESMILRESLEPKVPCAATHRAGLEAVVLATAWISLSSMMISRGPAHRRNARRNTDPQVRPAPNAISQRRFSGWILLSFERARHAEQPMHGAHVGANRPTA